MTTNDIQLYIFVRTYQYLVHWLHLSLSLPLFTSETPLLLWIDCLHWWQDWLWPLTPPPFWAAVACGRGWPAAFFIVFFFPLSTLDAFVECSAFPFRVCSTDLDFGLPLAIILFALGTLPLLYFPRPALSCTVQCDCFPPKVSCSAHAHDYIITCFDCELYTYQGTVIVTTIIMNQLPLLLVPSCTWHTKLGSGYLT